MRKKEITCSSFRQATYRSRDVSCIQSEKAKHEFNLFTVEIIAVSKTSLIVENRSIYVCRYSFHACSPWAISKNMKYEVLFELSQTVISNICVISSNWLIWLKNKRTKTVRVNFTKFILEFNSWRRSFITQHAWRKLPKRRSSLRIKEKRRSSLRFLQGL